jgi:hypothetical protein
MRTECVPQSRYGPLDDPSANEVGVTFQNRTPGVIARGKSYPGLKTVSVTAGREALFSTSRITLVISSSQASTGGSSGCFRAVQATSKAWRFISSRSIADFRLTMKATRAQRSRWDNRRSSSERENQASISCRVRAWTSPASRATGRESLAPCSVSLPRSLSFSVAGESR